MTGPLNRDEVLKILKEHVKQTHLLRHCLSVEASMRAYAEKFGEDPEYWGAIGLLHDVDFEKFPHDHPNHTAEILTPYGYDEEFIKNIESHCRSQEIVRETMLQKTLIAVDEMPGFILACALVRPDKSLDSLEVKSVKKKMKDKAFAKAVNRDTLINTAQDMGITIEEHIEFLISALREAGKKAEYQEIPLLAT
jgi:uncharacterized domain HDIG